MSDYPEHKKLKAIRDKSQCVGEFLDWLGSEKEIQLAKWVERSRNHSELVTIMTPKLDLLSEFFEIDQKKLSDEKDKMLEEQRKLNNERANLIGKT